jgi:hypothetical protein
MGQSRPNEAIDFEFRFDLEFSNPRQGPPHGGELRQAAGAGASVVEGLVLTLAWPLVRPAAIIAPCHSRAPLPAALDRRGFLAKMATVMPRTLRTFRTVLAASATISALLPSLARGEDALSPAAQRGLVFVRSHCAHCHSIDKVSPSPRDGAAAPHSARALSGRKPRGTSRRRHHHWSSVDA